MGQEQMRYGDIWAQKAKAIEEISDKMGRQLDLMMAYEDGIIDESGLYEHMRRTE